MPQKHHQNASCDRRDAAEDGVTKKALRAETECETKRATRRRVPYTYNRSKYFVRTKYKLAPRVLRERTKHTNTKRSRTSEGVPFMEMDFNCIENGNEANKTNNEAWKEWRRTICNKWTLFYFTIDNIPMIFVRGCAKIAVLQRQ
jgi:hypothetical protein